MNLGTIATADCQATFVCCRLQAQAHQEFLTGTQEHLHVEGMDDQDLVHEALQSLESEIKAWIEQLRQAKVQSKTVSTATPQNSKSCVAVLWNPAPWMICAGSPTVRVVVYIAKAVLNLCILNEASGDHGV